MSQNAAEFRVYDCFIYDGEECLDLRLRLHWDKVDWFVIAEANVTFTGQKKDYLFDPEKYQWAASKIRYIQLDERDFPDCKRPWDREKLQRDALAQGIFDALPGDTVLVSDVDEILLPEVIGKVAEGTFVTFQQLMMYFYGDYLCISQPFWRRAHAVRAETALQHSIEDIRSNQALYDLKEVLVANAGWHFSYLGGIESVARKLERFSHQRLNIGKFRDTDTNMQRMLAGKDIYRRSKLWGRVTKYDLGSDVVKSWFESRPELLAPKAARWRGDAMDVVQAFNARPKMSRRIQRLLLGIWNRI